MDISNADAFRKQIAEAQSMIQQFYGLRRAVDNRLNDLRELVRANANFLPDKERDAELLALEILKIPENIAEAVKITLFVATARKEALTPVQIKEQAEQRGFSFTEYTNPMASIHSVLKRMREADPPQAKFDEEKGTYTYTLDRPHDVYDRSVYDFLNRVAWLTLVEQDKEKAAQISNDTVTTFMTLVSAVKEKRGKGRFIDAGAEVERDEDE